tara:strand:- start:576 stop:1382 length:807 start_codon:yes stop_codon:yes gene_type:complete
MLQILVTLFVLFSQAQALASASFELWQKDYRPDSSLEARDIYIYLPSGYAESNSSYQTIYMHDGQNLFDPTRAYLGKTWRAESTLNYLIENNLIEPVVVIAIDNTSERLWDYTPSPSSQYGGGGANQYLSMIAEELIPLVEANFKVQQTPDSRAILGSSLGGLVSLSSIVSHPNTFSKVAALSPSIWWDKKIILSQLDNSPYLPQKIWIDSGSLEVEISEDVALLENQLLTRMNQEQLRAVIQTNADHSEEFWAQRLPYVLHFLFSKN